jgi:peptidoglycan biosynthesis protein MviN/MurJ (putative lipid II flippase)
MAPPKSARKTVLAIAGVFVTRSLGMILATVISVLMGNKFGIGVATDGFFFARRIAMGCAESAQRVTNIVLVPGLTSKLNSRDPEQASHAWSD